MSGKCISGDYIFGCGQLTYTSEFQLPLIKGIYCDYRIKAFSVIFYTWRRSVNTMTQLRIDNCLIHFLGSPISQGRPRRETSSFLSDLLYNWKFAKPELSRHWVSWVVICRSGLNTYTYMYFYTYIYLLAIDPRTQAGAHHTCRNNKVKHTLVSLRNVRLALMVNSCRFINALFTRCDCNFRTYLLVLLLWAIKVKFKVNPGCRVAGTEISSIYRVVVNGSPFPPLPYWVKVKVRLDKYHWQLN